MTTIKRSAHRRVSTYTDPYFVSCKKLPVRSDILDNSEMSDISGEGFWGAVAAGVGRGIFGGAVGVAAGVGSAIILHYYGDDIIATVDETISKIDSEIDEISETFIQMGNDMFH